MQALPNVILQDADRKGLLAEVALLKHLKPADYLPLHFQHRLHQKIPLHEAFDYLAACWQSQLFYH